MNYGNLGICYKAIDSFNLAIQNYQHAVEIAQQIDLKYDLAIHFMNLGVLYKDMAVYDSSLHYFDKSMSLCAEMNLEYGIMLNKINVGTLYLLIEEWTKAETLFRESMVLANHFKLTTEKNVLLKNLYFAFKGQAEPDSALAYYEKYTAYNDSLDKVETSRQIAELEAKYENEKKLREITLLKEEVYHEKSKNSNYIIVFLIIIFLIVSAALVQYFYSRTKRLKNIIHNKEQEELRNELVGKEKELVSNAMHMARLNDLTENVTLKLKQVIQHVSQSNKNSLREIISDLQIATPDNAWQEFETRFENVHKEFYQTLTELFPDLSPTEIRICSFIRLNMTSKDIAILTNRSVRTIENTRNNIRKKLELTPETNLTGFLLSF